MYRDYIDSMKTEWVGVTVKYDGAVYQVVDVDYNGSLLINKKARFTDTTAVSALQVERVRDGKKESSL